MRKVRSKKTRPQDFLNAALLRIKELDDDATMVVASHRGAVIVATMDDMSVKMFSKPRGIHDIIHIARRLLCLTANLCATVQSDASNQSVSPDFQTLRQSVSDAIACLPDDTAN